MAGSPGAFGYDDGTGSAAKFSTLRGICTDNGDLYAVSALAIRKIVIQTGQVTTVWQSPNGNDSYEHICTDGAAVYFTSPNAEYSMYKLALSSGLVAAFAGRNGTTQPSDGIGTNADFAIQQSIGIDGTSVYVADRVSTDPVRFSVRKIDLANAAVGTIAADLPFWINSISSREGKFYLSTGNRILSMP